MKNLVLLTNEALHLQTLTAASNEKSATLLLLEHLAEVDHRRLYAVMGYSSLWLYVNQALGYSETQSSERVSAMRLMVKVPEVKKELEAGKLTLTATAKLATHIRREKIAPAETLNLLKSVMGKSSREVDRVLASESTVVARPDQVKVITAERTKITIEVDENFLTLMNRVKELKGHVGSSPQDLFKMGMQELVKRYEVKTKPVAKTRAAHTKTEKELPAKKVLLTPAKGGGGANSRYIPVSLKNSLDQN